MQASAPTPSSLLTKGTFARFTKLAENKPGLIDVGYWTEGVLDTDVIVGESVGMWRHRRAARGSERDPQDLSGAFNTSTVERIEHLTYGDGKTFLIHTRNSTWRLDLLP